MNRGSPRPNETEKRKKAHWHNLTSPRVEIKQSETKLASHPERVVTPANFYSRERKIGGIVAEPYYNPGQGTRIIRRLWVFV